MYSSTISCQVLYFVLYLPNLALLVVLHRYRYVTETHTFTYQLNRFIAHINVFTNMAHPFLMRSTDYMRLALSLAEQSPPKPSNFRVGAVLVDETENRILSTGFTLELPGNTHAEQCCLQKFAAIHGKSEEEVSDVLPKGTVIYTTMEPCGKRMSGNLPCVDRILRTKTGINNGIAKVYHGVQEPETFVGQNTGKGKLQDGGITCIHVSGMEDEILKIATAGHQPKEL